MWCRMEEEQCHISPVPSRGFLLDSSCLWSLGMGFYGLCSDAGEGVLLLVCFLRNNHYLHALTHSWSITHEVGVSSPAPTGLQRASILA